MHFYFDYRLNNISNNVNRVGHSFLRNNNYLLECLHFGTLDKTDALGGKLKCRHFFTISNGVRPGGILSPPLFAVYMDDLSSLLNASRIGCHVSDVYTY